VGIRINRSLSSGGNFAVVRFAVFAIALIANFSESNFACMTPIGFLLLLVAIERLPEFLQDFDPASTRKNSGPKALVTPHLIA